MLEPDSIEFDGIKAVFLPFFFFFTRIFFAVGWDISSRDIAQACREARVLDIAIQDKLQPLLSKMKPRPSIYCPDFIAANQEDRADNLLKGDMFILVLW